MRSLRSEVGRFALIGLAGFIIDAGVFNVLRLTLLRPERFEEGPLLAKVIATSLAIAASWLGNRHFTFAGDRRPDWAREAFEYLLVSLGGLAIGLACLWVSHYLLGFTSLLADNIATNVVGLVLGTAFRFTFYRVWVFRDRSNVDELDVPALARTPATVAS